MVLLTKRELRQRVRMSSKLQTRLMAQVCHLFPYGVLQDTELEAALIKCSLEKHILAEHEQADLQGHSALPLFPSFSPSFSSLLSPPPSSPSPSSPFFLPLPLFPTFSHSLSSLLSPPDIALPPLCPSASAIRESGPAEPCTNLSNDCTSL